MDETQMQEVQPLREVPRVPIHCDVPMRKLAGIGHKGTPRTVWVCAKECGAQIMEPEPEPAVKKEG